MIITSITPGPSNILMMNEAKRFSFLGSWKFMIGILAGFAVLGIMSGVFTTGLYNLVPVIEPYFKRPVRYIYSIWLGRWVCQKVPRRILVM